MDTWLWITIVLGGLVVILGAIGIVYRTKDQREQDRRNDEAQARLDEGAPPPRRTGTGAAPRYDAAPSAERVTRRDAARRPSSRVSGARYEDREPALFDPAHPLNPANPVNQSTYHPGYGGGHFHRPVEDAPAARHTDPAPDRHGTDTTPQGIPASPPAPTPDPTPSTPPPSAPSSYDYGGSSGSSSTGSDSGGGYGGGSSGSSDSGGSSSGGGGDSGGGSY